MLKVGIKSIELSDFDEVKDETEQIQWLVNEFRVQTRGSKPRIDACDTLGHPMKQWEWSRALKLIKSKYPTPKDVSILSIGSAYCPLEPSLAYLGYTVHEAEPDAGCGKERFKINEFLTHFNSNPTIWSQVGYGGLTANYNAASFDVVMSISTIEHVDLDNERTSWKESADLVKPGGLIIVTMDCMVEAKKGYMYDDVRWTNYDLKLIKKRVDELKSYGFKPVGEEDYVWHGNHVNDYSFSFISMIKNGGK